MKKNIRWETKTFYTQSRFNLLTENVEGFSALAAELVLTRDCKNKTRNNGHLVKRVQRIIGEFNLDPIRSLDVIFEVMRRDCKLAGFSLAETGCKDSNTEILKDKSSGEESNKIIEEKAENDVSKAEIVKEENQDNKNEISEIRSGPHETLFSLLSLFSKTNMHTILKSKLATFKISENPDYLLELIILVLDQKLADLHVLWGQMTPESDEILRQSFAQRENLAFDYFESNFMVLLSTDTEKEAQEKERMEKIEEVFRSGNGAEKDQINHSIKMIFFEKVLQSRAVKILDQIVKILDCRIVWSVVPNLLAAKEEFLGWELDQIAKK